LDNRTIIWLELGIEAPTLVLVVGATVLGGGVVTVVVGGVVVVGNAIVWRLIGSCCAMTCVDTVFGEEAFFNRND